jgi:hypothetical protein
MTNYLDVLLAQKELLQAELPRLLAGASPEQATELRTAYQQARQNWNEAVNKALVPGDAIAAALMNQFEAAHREIEDSCRRLDDLACTIGKITAGVVIGSKLIKLLV